MPVSDEMVELACAAEQQVGGRYSWPDEWTPELAAEYRAGMRVFLSSIVPFIEAAALEEAARMAEMHGRSAREGGGVESGTLIAASIRARIG